MTKLAFSLTVILGACTRSVTPADPVDAAVDSPVRMIDAPAPCSATADTCTGESICIAGACEAAFGRLYDIRTVPTTDPNGYEWDVGGGAPDLFVAIGVNGVLVATTSTVNDQFSATFAGSYTVQPIGAGSLVLVAYDEDIAFNDFAYRCAADPLTAQQLRTRHLACASGGSMLSFTIEPR